MRNIVIPGVQMLLWLLFGWLLFFCHWNFSTWIVINFYDPLKRENGLDRKTTRWKEEYVTKIMNMIDICLMILVFTEKKRMEKKERIVN